MRSGIWPPNSSRPVLSYEKQLFFRTVMATSDVPNFVDVGRCKIAGDFPYSRALQAPALRGRR
jgi:hypothetical protein